MVVVVQRCCRECVSLLNRASINNTQVGLTVSQPVQRVHLLKQQCGPYYAQVRYAGYIMLVMLCGHLHPGFVKEKVSYLQK